VKWTQGNAIVVALLVLYALLFVPIWQSVLLGLLFASACAPVLRKVQRTLKSKRSLLAYATASTLLISFLLVLTYLVIQTYSFLVKLTENPDTITHLTGQIFELKQKSLEWLAKQGFWTAEQTSEHLNHLITAGTLKGNDFLLNTSKYFLTQTPQILLSLVIFFLAFSAFLLGGPRLFSLLANKFALRDMSLARERFESICARSLGAVLVTGLLQATLVAIGSAIAGFPSLFLIFLVTFICSMIPLVGAASVPLILAVFQFFNGDYSNVVILAVTAAIAGTIDNFLKAYLFSRAAKTNPLISLMALLGGIMLFGFPGLFIAPVVEQLLMSSLEDQVTLSP